METWKKVILALSKTTLVFCIFLFVGSITVNKIIGNQDQVKTWLQESGIYNPATIAIRQQIIQDNTVLNQAPNVIIQQAIDLTITEQRVQKLAESGVDDIYAWLNGKTVSLQFTASLEGIKSDFTNTVANNLISRLSSLPPCSQGTIPLTTDISSITCIPRGFQIQQEIERIRSSFQNMQTNQLSPEENAQPLQTQALSQSLQPLKTYYQWSAILPIVSVVIFFICAIVIVVLSRPYHRSLRTFATALIPYGLFCLLLSLLAPRFIVNTVESALAPTLDTAFAGPVQKLAELVGASVGTILIRTGAMMLGVGAILLVSYKLIQKRNYTSDLPQQTKN